MHVEFSRTVEEHLQYYRRPERQWARIRARSDNRISHDVRHLDGSRKCNVQRPTSLVGGRAAPPHPVTYRYMLREPCLLASPRSSSVSLRLLKLPLASASRSWRSRSRLYRKERSSVNLLQRPQHRTRTRQPQQPFAPQQQHSRPRQQRTQRNMHLRSR